MIEALDFLLNSRSQGYYSWCLTELNLDFQIIAAFPLNPAARYSDVGASRLSGYCAIGPTGGGRVFRVKDIGQWTYNQTSRCMTVS